MALHSFALLFPLAQYCSGLSVNSGISNSNEPGSDVYTKFIGDCVDDKTEFTFTAHYSVWGKSQSVCESRCNTPKTVCKGYVMGFGQCLWLWVDTEQHSDDWKSNSNSPIAKGNGEGTYDCYRHDAPTGHAEENHAACHTAVTGEECHFQVQWAMDHGWHQHPEKYEGLTEKSAFEDFQEHLHKLPEHSEKCPMPCRT